MGLRSGVIGVCVFSIAVLLLVFAGPRRQTIAVSDAKATTTASHQPIDQEIIQPKNYGNGVWVFTDNMQIVGTGKFAHSLAKFCRRGNLRVTSVAPIISRGFPYGYIVTTEDR